MDKIVKLRGAGVSYVPSPSTATGMQQAVLLSPSEERKLVRKIDLHIIPVMFVLYLLQYLDKTSMGYAAIIGVIADTHLNGVEYSWISSFFYVGFLIGSPISAVALVKFPATKVVVVTVILWATTLMCMAIGHNFGGLAALRILLGVFEAAINPGFSIVTSMWYKPNEHALRHGLWYAGASIAYIFGGILAYAISHIRSGIRSWQVLFIIFGALTFVWGVAMFFVLPINPQTAYFLSHEERSKAFARVQGLRHSADTRQWEPKQAKEALLDVRSWLFFLLCIFTTLPGGGLTAFGSIITQSFGYTVFQTQLLGMITGTFLLIFLILTVSISTLFEDARCISIAVLNVVSLAGVLMIKFIPAHHKWGQLGGFWLISAYASSFPTILSLVSSNITGRTKGSTVNAMLFLGFCMGYIIGPLTFLAQEAPYYPTAYNVMIASFVLNTVIIMSMRQTMLLWNKRRDKAGGSASTLIANASRNDTMELDRTDWENKGIRYSV
ncbi:MFS general substrate transporter [Myriangium duriaei CBS 260.36]|uniref:MFS general substrate transporter n=1 Tax=Myriangium duriaei CBS 260.36 TaxID=1168546 RepID=A0A9P4J601_9PEZI|nr:MFS general substrate transporter [Myriangium duriaei CBS 260.36]